MIDLGYPLEDTDRDGLTPLATAVLYRSHDVINKLIDAGANINGKESSPLTIAITKIQWDLAKKLVKLGANVNHQNGYGTTALMKLCCNSTCADLEMYPILLRAGANLDLVDHDGMNAWCHFIKHHNPPMDNYFGHVKTLFKKTHITHFRILLIAMSQNPNLAMFVNDYLNSPFLQTRCSVEQYELLKATYKLGQVPEHLRRQIILSI